MPRPDAEEGAEEAVAAAKSQGVCMVEICEDEYIRTFVL